MQILEHENRGSPLSESLEKLAPGGEAFGTIPGLAVRAEADEWAEILQEQPRTLALKAGYRLHEFPLNFLRRVRIEDSRVRFRHFREGPIRDAIPVWEGTALAPVDEVRFRVDYAREFIDEPALPNPRHANEREELGRAFLASTGKRVAEEIELAMATDEPGPGLHDIDAEP
jgi:hypothetical protein